VATKRLYYEDCYLTKFNANIIRLANGGTTAYFDRSAFYPASGGQPGDLGICNGVDVLDVVDEEAGVAHHLAAPIEIGPAICEINWTRRYDHMQQHTGQHLLSAVFLDLFGFETLSFHMGSHVSTIELSCPELTQRQIDEAEEKAAQLIREARPVRISFSSAAEVEGLRRASSREGELRIIEIEGVDRSACGGTHVRSTAELGLILTRRQEKLRGHIRLEFVCGSRALRQARSDFRLLNEMARQAGSPIERLSSHVQSVRERLAQAEKDRSRLALELAQYNGRARWEQTPVAADGTRRLHLEVPSLDEETRGFARSFVESGAAALLLSCVNPPSFLLACSGDSGVNAGAALKAVLQSRGGRGGGSPVFAQGSVPNKEDLPEVVKELGF
jgi:alanyl-tRNA synthetase